MVQKFKCENHLASQTKILFGNDTDVTNCSIIKIHRDAFVFTSIFIDENGKTTSESYDWNLEEFTAHFDLQYGSPMQYINQSTFNWMIAN